MAASVFAQPRQADVIAKTLAAIDLGRRVEARCRATDQPELGGLLEAGGLRYRLPPRGAQEVGVVETALRGLVPYRALMRLNCQLAKGQAQAGATSPSTLTAKLGKPVKETFFMLIRNAWAVIDHFHFQIAALR